MTSYCPKRLPAALQTWLFPAAHQLLNCEWPVLFRMSHKKYVCVLGLYLSCFLVSFPSIKMIVLLNDDVVCTNIFLQHINFSFCGVCKIL